MATGNADKLAIFQRELQRHGLSISKPGDHSRIDAFLYDNVGDQDKPETKRQAVLLDHLFQDHKKAMAQSSLSNVFSSTNNGNVQYYDFGAENLHLRVVRHPSSSNKFEVEVTQGEKPGKLVHYQSCNLADNKTLNLRFFNEGGEAYKFDLTRTGARDVKLDAYIKRPQYESRGAGGDGYALMTTGSFSFTAPVSSQPRPEESRKPQARPLETISSTAPADPQLAKRTGVILDKIRESFSDMPKPKQIVLAEAVAELTGPKDNVTRDMISKMHGAGVLKEYDVMLQAVGKEKHRTQFDSMVRIDSRSGEISLIAPVSVASAAKPVEHKPVKTISDAVKVFEQHGLMTGKGHMLTPRFDQFILETQQSAAYQDICGLMKRDDTAPDFALSKETFNTIGELASRKQIDPALAEAYKMLSSNELLRRYHGPDEAAVAKISQKLNSGDTILKEVPLEDPAAGGGSGGGPKLSGRPF